MKEYFLTSRHGNCGSTVLFHNKDEHGYGSNLNELEKYTELEAKKGHSLIFPSSRIYVAG